MNMKKCSVCEISFEPKSKSQFLCSGECRIEWNFLLSMKRCEEKTKEPLKDFLDREYTEKQRSYRSLMAEIGCANRTLTKILNRLEIPIRRGSEAIKAQWKDNEKRKDKQREFLSRKLKGKQSEKRISDKNINDRLNKNNLQLTKRWFESGSTKIEFSCLKCGSKRLGDLKNLKFYACLECDKSFKSHGERKIKDWLSENGFTYQTQYKISGCRNILPLPFDIAVIESNGAIRCLIEYDGVQHYHPVDRFGGGDEFEKVKTRDKIKNDYCVDKGIELIRIPYYDYKNINEILCKKLKETP